MGSCLCTYIISFWCISNLFWGKVPCILSVWCIRQNLSGRLQRFSRDRSLNNRWLISTGDSPILKMLIFVAHELTDNFSVAICVTTNTIFSPVPFVIETWQTNLIDLITTDVVVIRSYSSHRMILNLFAFEQRVFIIAMLEILFGDIFFWCP